MTNTKNPRIGCDQHHGAEDLLSVTSIFTITNRVDISILAIATEKTKTFGDISSNPETKFLTIVVGWSGPTSILPNRTCPLSE